MKKNMSNADRVVRLVIVAIISALYFTNIVSGLLGTILLVAACVFLVTSLVRWCPLYSLLGLNTCQIKETKK